MRKDALREIKEARTQAGTPEQFIAWREIHALFVVNREGAGYNSEEDGAKYEEKKGARYERKGNATGADRGYI